ARRRSRRVWGRRVTAGRARVAAAHGGRLRGEAVGTGGRHRRQGGRAAGETRGDAAGAPLRRPLGSVKTVQTLEAHPHAQAVLGAALNDSPAHAYLLHGPAGSGKRKAARDFAAELLAKQARDPENAKMRAQHDTHVRSGWVPSGAHEMLRKDVDETV